MGDLYNDALLSIIIIIYEEILLWARFLQGCRMVVIVFPACQLVSQE